MDNWTILNISPTDNREAIKRAYMTQLPKYNPEDDPEGFSRLRLAYEQVLSELDELDLQKVKETPLTLFSKRVTKLYDDFERRCDLDEWRELLTDEACVRLDLEDLTCDGMLVIFMAHSYLPKKVWMLLNDRFEWTKKKESLKKTFPPNYVDFVMSNCEPTKSQSEILNFDLFDIIPDYLGEITAAHYDEWLRLYYEMENLTYVPETPRVLEIKKAIESLPIRHIYYDLLWAYMLGIKGEAEPALEIIQPIIEKFPLEPRARYIHARVLLIADKVEESLHCLEDMIKDDPTDQAVKRGIIETLVILKRHEQARMLILEILSEEPYNHFAMHIFRLVTDRLINIYKEKHEKCDPDDPEYFEITLTLAKHYLNFYDYAKCEALLKDFPEEKYHDNPAYNEYMADCYRARGDLEKAIELYEKNIAIEKNYRIFVKYSSTLLESDQLLKAIESIDKALKLEDNDRLSLAYLHDNKGLVLHELKQYNDALQSYDTALEINDQVVQFYIHKAKAYQSLRRYSEAIDYSEQAILVFPYASEAYIVQMEIYYNAFYFDQMVELADRAEQTGFDNPRIKYHKACALHMLDKYSEAEDLLISLIDDEYDDGFRDFFHEELAYIALANARFGTALYHIKESIKLNGDYPYRHVLMGDIFNYSREYAEALIIYNKVLEKHPNNLTALRGRGNVYFDQENYALAEKDLKIIVVENEFNNAEYNMKLGIIYHRLGRHEESLQHLLTVVSKNEEMGIRWSKAYLYTLVGIKYSGSFNDAKNAIKFYNIAHESEPDYDQVIRRMGDIHLYYYKDYQTAIEFYDKTINLNPKDPFGYALKGYTLKKINKKYNLTANSCFKKALSLINEQLKVGDISLDFQLCTAFCYVGLKKYKLAHRIYMDILVKKDQIKWGECYYGLGLISESNKKYKEAIDYYEQALKCENSIRNNGVLEDLRDTLKMINNDQGES